jgi:hypothetical protein
MFPCARKITNTMGLQLWAVSSPRGKRNRYLETQLQSGCCGQPQAVPSVEEVTMYLAGILISSVCRKKQG